MANIESVIAHTIKLAVTLACMTYFRDSFSFKVIDQVWIIRALQITLIHSILGIFRYGSSNITKRLRKSYEWSSIIVEVVPFALITTELLIKYNLNKELRLLILALALSPTAIEFSSAKIRDHSKLSKFTNFIFALQALVLTFSCLQNGYYGGLSFAGSLIVSRFLSEDFCDHYEVPFVDMTEYSLCFAEIFAVYALNEL